MASNRDLDAEIAEKIYGWKPMQVGKDANGENACEVLTKNGESPEGYCFPNVGKLHRGFMTPQFSSNRDKAIELAVKVGLKMDISEIDFNDWEFPEKLAKRCLEFFQTNVAKKGLY